MRRGKRAAQAGFSLIEILVVVAIMALFTTVVGVAVVKHLRDARVTKAKADLLTWETAANSFFLDNGFHPSTEQGLQALVSKPSVGRRPNHFPRHGYVVRPVFQDPWGQPYGYVSPGVHVEVDIFTLGADGQAGGTAHDRDLGTWNLHLPED